MIEELRRVLLRDLEGARAEIEAYPDDQTPWREVPGLPNSGGTLALHLAGNLRHFVGAELGGSGYVRHREAEFSRRDVPRAALAAELAAAAEEVGAALAALPAEQLAAPYPAPVLGKSIATGLFLVHLAAHLGYHLGQLDYHRRAVTGDRRSAGAMSLPVLLGP